MCIHYSFNIRWVEEEDDNDNVIHWSDLIWKPPFSWNFVLNLSFMAFCLTVDNCGGSTDL